MHRLFVLMTASVITASTFVFGVVVTRTSVPQDLSAAEPAVRSAVAQVLAEREEEIAGEGSVPFGDAHTINVLLLGIDSRKEGLESHCDAIHMLSFHLTDYTITITSVPRGTTATLPSGRTYEPYEYYLSNACAYGGIPYGQKQIEAIVGVKADYVVTVGFSEALGIFRALELPTTDTLEYLRHRRSYQIGDPQRSHNQALFMKDMALQVFSGNRLPTSFLYILYSLVRTDMDFQTAKALYTAYDASGLSAHSERISLIMKPPYPVTDMHYDPANAEEQVGKLIDFLRGKVSSVDLSFTPLEEIQEELVAYLRESLADDTAVIRVFEERLWEQVEDPKVREELEFRFLDRYVDILAETDPALAREVITDYILRKEYYGQIEWQERGERRLDEFLTTYPLE